MAILNERLQIDDVMSTEIKELAEVNQKCNPSILVITPLRSSGEAKATGDFSIEAPTAVMVEPVVPRIRLGRIKTPCL